LMKTQSKNTANLVIYAIKNGYLKIWVHFVLPKTSPCISDP
jgi:hypothetical protein